MGPMVAAGVAPSAPSQAPAPASAALRGRAGLAGALRAARGARRSASTGRVAAAAARAAPFADRSPIRGFGAGPASVSGARARSALGATAASAEVVAERRPVREGVPSVSVHVRGMHKHYRTRKGIFKAVDDVSLDIPRGSITALLGPSGSGKTTLLRMIAGLETPTAGRIFYDDRDVTDLRVQERNLGFLFQGYALFRHMNLANNIAFGPRARKLDLDIDERVQELLTMVGLQGLGARYPQQLSGGQRQRVALARALASNPQLLLLDEPFGALDPLIRKSLRSSLKEIVTSIGITSIMVTHDQEEAWDLADEVVIFHKGRIEQRGRPEEIRKRPTSPFVMNFLGDVVHLTSHCQFARRMGVVTDKPFVMIRPANISIHKSFEVPDVCAATIKDKKVIGWLVRYSVEFDDGVLFEINVGLKEDATFYGFDAGDRMYLHADTKDLVPFTAEEINDPLFNEIMAMKAELGVAA